MARTRSINEREEQFCLDLIEKGLDMETAYGNSYSIAPSWNASRVRSEARKIAKRPEVAAYLEALVLDRQNDHMLDEKFVIDMLKEAALKNRNSPTGIRALELLGKTMGLFKERQIIDDPGGKRATANKLFDMANRMEAGENVEAELASMEKTVGGDSLDDFKIERK